MKTRHFFEIRSPGAAILAVWAASIFLLCAVVPPLSAVPLTGSNGQTVDFAGVKSAGPKGLVVQVKPDGPELALTWDKFDLAKIRAAHPQIDEAYKKSLGGETTELNLGSFAPKKPAPGSAGPKENALKYPGYYRIAVRGGADENFNRADFALSLPKNGEPKGVLLVSRGQNGQSLQYVPLSQGVGPWARFQEKHGFAIISYDFNIRAASGTDALKLDEFVHAEKGSGRALMAALEEIEKEAGKSLSKLPIAVYGLDMLGAAYAFNFTQWKPDQVIAAVVAKGAFYSAPLTEESVKVPVLLMWGEYDQEAELWEATGTHAEVFGNNLNLKPNWIYAMEPRGATGESPSVYFFGVEFLEEMIEKRINEEGELEDLDRANAWVGDLQEFTIGKLDDPEAVLTADQTWLPNQSVAKSWEKFVNGTYPIPSAPGAE